MFSSSRAMSSLALAVLLVGLCASQAVGSSPGQALLESFNFTGVARVSDGGVDSVVWETALGFSDIGQTVPLQLNTKFNIASNSKLLTTIALYQLQEAGKVNLSDSIGHYLDQTDFEAFGYPNISTYCPVLANSSTCQVVTFVQLLGMSAGIPDNTYAYEDSPFRGTIGLEVGSTITAPLLFVPGTAYYYSNPSFLLAGYFVERLSGVSYGTYIAQHITGPLNMTDTSIDFFNNQLVYDPRKAGTFHEYIDATNRSQLLARGQCSFDFDTGAAGPAGGFLSTARDEAVLYYTLFNTTSHGRPLFRSPDSLRAIMAPTTFAFAVGPDQRVFYGQGIYVIYTRSLAAPPTTVRYEGAFICTLTVNLMDLTPMATGGAPRLVQAFRNKDTHYVARSDFEAAVATQRGRFLDVESKWQFQDVVPIAQALLALFFPPS